MTQEEKQLLLKDLCARLPYGVMCFAPDYEFGAIGKLWSVDPFEDLDPEIYILYPKGNTISKFYSEVKPYLRPMSSMTEEEVKEIQKINWQFGKSKAGECYVGDADDGYCSVSQMVNILGYLNEHHFDYRGLIPMGLAIEAPNNMYKN